MFSHFSQPLQRTNWKGSRKQTNWEKWSCRVPSVRTTGYFLQPSSCGGQSTLAWRAFVHREGDRSSSSTRGAPGAVTCGSTAGCLWFCKAGNCSVGAGGLSPTRENGWRSSLHCSSHLSRFPRDAAALQHLAQTHHRPTSPGHTPPAPSLQSVSKALRVKHSIALFSGVKVFNHYLPILILGDGKYWL